MGMSVINYIIYHNYFKLRSTFCAVIQINNNLKSTKVLHVIKTLFHIVYLAVKHANRFNARENADCCGYKHES